MAGKRSQVDRSKIDRGSDLGHRIETTVELERNRQEQLFEQSIVSFRQGFMRQPWRLYSWLRLAIAIAVITLPFINRLAIASLDIPRIICLAMILLVSEGMRFIELKFFDDNLVAKKPWLFWTFYPLRVCVAIALIVYSFISLPLLIQLLIDSLRISCWLSAIMVLLCFISIVFLDRFRIKNYILNALCLPFYTIVCILEVLYIPLYVVFKHEDRLVYQPWLWWWLKNR